MELIRRELSKIECSRSGALLNILVILLVGLYSIILTHYNQTMTITNGLEFVIGIANNINMFGIMMLISVYYTSVLFAKDYEDRTYLYASIRKISIYKIYLARIVAIVLYIVKLYIFIDSILLIYGFFKWGFAPLPMCISTGESITRVGLLLIEICVSNLFWISVTVLASVIFKNQIIAIIIGVFSNTVINIITQLLPQGMRRFTISPYNDFYANGLFEVSEMGQFVQNINLGLANYLVYGAIVYVLSLWLVHVREGRG